MMCLLSLLDVFRECGGARCSHTMISHPQCRQQALNIVHKLMLSTGGDDDMGTLLGFMHNAKITSLQLKTHILKVGHGDNRRWFMRGQPLL